MPKAAETGCLERCWAMLLERRRGVAPQFGHDVPVLLKSRPARYGDVMSTPAAIAQAQLDAYNAQQLDAFCAYFADDVVVADLNGPVKLEGRAAFRALYAKVFGDFPDNRVELLGRIAVGNVVIDHERVLRKPGMEPFEVAAIYTFRGLEIARVDFARA